MPDQIRWIDTKVLVHCLTKDMKSNVLQETLRSGIYNIEPTAERVITKLAKQKHRRMKSRAPPGDIEGEIEANDWEPGVIIQAHLSQARIAKRTPTQFQSHGCESGPIEQRCIEYHVVKKLDCIPVAAGVQLEWWKWKRCLFDLFKAFLRF